VFEVVKHWPNQGKVVLWYAADAAKTNCCDGLHALSCKSLPWYACCPVSEQCGIVSSKMLKQTNGCCSRQHPGGWWSRRNVNINLPKINQQAPGGRQAVFSVVVPWKALVPVVFDLGFPSGFLYRTNEPEHVNDVWLLAMGGKFDYVPLPEPITPPEK